MQRRERILLIAFLAAGGCALVYWGYKTQVADRLEEADESVARAQKSVARKQREVVESRAAQLDLARWEKLSLPPDPNTAVPQYQAFLLELLVQCGFAEPTITPRAPALEDETYWRLPYDVEARGSLESLVTFVDAFHRIKLLHKLGRLSMTPSAGADGDELDLRFGVEALALVTDAGGESADPSAASENSASPEQSADGSPFAQLLSGNLLMPRGPGASIQPAKVAAQVYLTGTIVTADRPEALFFNRATGESLVLRVGDRLAAGDVQGELVDLGFRDVVMEADGAWYTLSPGQNLGQRQRLSDAEMLARALDASQQDVTLSPP
jgi:hypothetical protein